MVPAAWSRVYARRCCKAALNLCGAHFDSSYWFGVLLIVTARHAPLRAPNKLKPVENVQKAVRKKTARHIPPASVPLPRSSVPAPKRLGGNNKPSGSASRVQRWPSVFNAKNTDSRDADAHWVVEAERMNSGQYAFQYLCASGVGAEQSSLVTSRRRRRPSTWWPWTACTPGRCTSARSASRWSRPPAPCRRACG